MNFEEKRLHQTLINLTKGFSYKDSVEYRKERNWQKYDASNPIERLLIIIKEVQQYKKGYFEEDNLFGEQDENNYDDIY